MICSALGVYGGNDFEGIQSDGRLEPKRFFALYRDRVLLEWVTAHFEPVYFRQAALGVERHAVFYFRSVVLRHAWV